MDVSGFKERVAAMQAALKHAGFDAFLAIKPEHVRYISGAWGYSTRPEYAMPRRLIAVVVPSSGDPVMIVPKIERLFVGRRTWLSDVRHHVEWEQSGEMFGGIALLEKVLQEKSLLRKRIGVEGSFLSVRLHGLLEDSFPGTSFEDATALVEEIRMIKSPEEIEILRIGGRMAVAEYEAEAAAIRGGVREFEIAMKGRDAATSQFADRIADGDAQIPLDHPCVDGPQIITSGKRLDMVHAIASTRPIAAGDVVLLDFCRIPQYQAYRIGFSRMASLRELSGAEQDMFQATMEAYDKAVGLLRPGVHAEEPDLAAREVLDRAGLGETFVHRTGRGVGLELVERPEIGAGDKTPLKPGMVVTIEPSIYYPDFAVHVEDTYLITNDGYECLTECPREFRRVT